MFKCSLNWIKKCCQKDVTSEKILEILNLQGFEIKSTEDTEDDTVITIEVKANRPDMLSHIGVAREICAFLGEKIPDVPKYDVKIDNKNFPVDINISSSKDCRRYSGICIKNVDNTIETPQYIKDYLTKLGIHCINAVVDIANFMMLELGQPFHTYDLDKISGNQINISEAESDIELETLGNKIVNVKNGDIIISDKDKILCVAGIIGAEASTVEKNSKNILIESAIFDEIKVRLSSRIMKTSTPSSFRFERGVDEIKTIDSLMNCAKLINETCKGEVDNVVFDYYPNPKNENCISIRTSRTNTLLGINVSQTQMKQFLEKYGFKCNVCDSDTLNVTCPSYRLDVFKEVDLIEEIARIYGYDNIEPKMPKVLMQYNNNTIWSNMDKIRMALRGMNFNEIITYSFIPSNSMKILEIDSNNELYSDILLKNPITPAYALMRPTLVYSLINCLAYNYSRNNTDLALFEIGRTYFKDESKDTGCNEVDTLGMIISGNRIRRGWGIEKDIKYTYYDIINYLSVILGEFNHKFELKKNQCPFFENGTGLDIIIQGKKVGFLGEIKKSVANKIPNAKLIKSKMFYCEIYLKYLNETSKTLSFESKYPPIKRLYNLVYDKNVNVSEIVYIMKKSSDLIKNIDVLDIYEKGMADNEHAVLFEINYCSNRETLTSEQIEQVEQIFLNELKQNLNVKLKK